MKNFYLVSLLFSYTLPLFGTTSPISLGPRPYYLVEKLPEGPLKKSLKKCIHKPVAKSEFSIGHRGAPLQFPEHTKESYEAAARMGAGVLECDVTFTKDLELVCRHSQCDLHTTTNILAIPELAEKCSTPFTPFDPLTGTSASAECCTSDISLKEFKSLCGKMDASNPMATTVEDFLNGTSPFRTDLYSECGTVLTHKESISLFKKLGTKMTPELKTPEVDMPFQGKFTQKMYAQKMIQEYRDMKIEPTSVFPQSFLLDDVLQWVREEGPFGKQSVYLDGRYELEDFDINSEASWKPSMAELKTLGVPFLAPPLWMLLDLNSDNKMVPSNYAMAAQKQKLPLIAWTLERSWPLSKGGGWYYQTVKDGLTTDGNTFEVIDVLHRQVGVNAIFTDWPATVTYYANCMDIN